MSSTLNIKTEIRDLSVLKDTCKRLGLKTKEGTHKLYASTEQGTGVWLPGWSYPVVIKQDGSIAYDNYHQRWGKDEELGKLKAEYTIDKVQNEVMQNGHSCYAYQDEQFPEHTSIRITLGGE